MATRKEIEEIRTEGGAEELARMAQLLGYRARFGQLTFNNGATATDLFDFFEDNPGAVEAVVQWVLDSGCNRDGSLLDEDDDEDEEEEETP